MIIYKAENKINGKIYIGQTTKSFEKRIRQHTVRSKNGSHLVIHRAIRKYGFECFDWIILQKCYSETHLNLAEKAYIQLYKLQGKKLYNSTDGGEGSTGYRHSEESRIKISKSGIGRKFSEDTRRKISASNKGRKLSDEQKKKMSDAIKGEKHPWWGKKLPEKTKDKISKSNTGKTRTEESKNKMREKATGVIRSEETKRKMSESHKGRAAWNKGKKGIYSEETIKKMSDAHKK